MRKVGSTPLTLAEAQELQARFDHEHGFDFPDGDVPRDGLSMSVFAALALCGEAGELANAIKKAQRAAWIGESPESHLQRAAGELGDVLAYLLKLASALHIPIDEAYLSTLSENCLRFPPRAVSVPGPIIAIAGPPGVGKTTIVEALGEEFGTCLRPQRNFAEVVQTLPLASSLLGGFAEGIGAADAVKPLVLDQDPAVAVRVFAQLLRERDLIPSDMLSLLYVELVEVESLLARRGVGRLTLFLDAEPPTLRARLAKQKRDQELPEEGWLREVRERCQSLRESMPRAQLIPTDGLSVDEVLTTVRRNIRLGSGY